MVRAPGGSPSSPIWGEGTESPKANNPSYAKCVGAEEAGPLLEGRAPPTEPALLGPDLFYDVRAPRRARLAEPRRAFLGPDTSLADTL